MAKLSITKLALFGSMGMCVGLGMYTFVYAKGFSYLSSAPEACVNCHVMREQYDGWQKSSHHNVAVCTDCHLPRNVVGKYFTKAENGFMHSLMFTLQTYPDHIQIRDVSRGIVNRNCVQCHGQLADHIAPKDGEVTDSRFCTRGHSNVGH